MDKASISVLNAAAAGVSSCEPTVMGSATIDLNTRPGDFGSNNLQGEMLASRKSFSTFVIDVDAGQDAMWKIIEFCKQVPDQTVILISASGMLSKMTFTVPYTDRITYEGLFNILGLSGSFEPTRRGGHKRQGGVNITFSRIDGKVEGGLVVGQLIAANSVRIIVGVTKFEKVTKQKQKKHEHKDEPVFVPVTVINYVQENDAN